MSSSVEGKAEAKFERPKWFVRIDPNQRPPLGPETKEAFDHCYILTKTEKFGYMKGFGGFGVEERERFEGMAKCYNDLRRAVRHSSIVFTTTAKIPPAHIVMEMKGSKVRLDSRLPIFGGHEQLMLSAVFKIIEFVPVDAIGCAVFFDILDTTKQTTDLYVIVDVVDATTKKATPVVLRLHDEAGRHGNGLINAACMYNASRDITPASYAESLEQFKSKRSLLSRNVEIKKELGQLLHDDEVFLQEKKKADTATAASSSSSSSSSSAASACPAPHAAAREDEVVLAKAVSTSSSSSATESASSAPRPSAKKETEKVIAEENAIINEIYATLGLNKDSKSEEQASKQIVELPPSTKEEDATDPVLDSALAEARLNLRSGSVLDGKHSPVPQGTALSAPIATPQEPPSASAAEAPDKKGEKRKREGDEDGEDRKEKIEESTLSTSSSVAAPAAPAAASSSSSTSAAIVESPEKEDDDSKEEEEAAPKSKSKKKNPNRDYRKKKRRRTGK